MNILNNKFEIETYKDAQVPNESLHTTWMGFNFFLIWFYTDCVSRHVKKNENRSSLNEKTWQIANSKHELLSYEEYYHEDFYREDFYREDFYREDF
jgi:hypothetical protein